MKWGSLMPTWGLAARTGLGGVPKGPKSGVSWKPGGVHFPKSAQLGGGKEEAWATGQTQSLKEGPALEPREAGVGPPQRRLPGTPGTTAQMQGVWREVRGQLSLGLAG